MNHLEAEASVGNKMPLRIIPKLTHQAIYKPQFLIQLLINHFRLYNPYHTFAQNPTMIMPITNHQASTLHIVNARAAPLAFTSFPTFCLNAPTTFPAGKY